MHGRTALVASRGFTLIELLVALTLMALLSVVLFGGLRFGMRAWETGSDHIEQASAIAAVQDLLRREVSQAKVAVRTADSGAPPSFVGTSEELTFMAPLPVHRGVGGSYMFWLGLHYDDGHANLVLRWQLYRPENHAVDSTLPENGTALLQDVAQITLSYYGAADPEQPPQWWDTWDGANGRPELVRMRLEFPPGDSRRWPDLIVRTPG